MGMMTFKVKMSIYLVCLLVFLIPANYILLPTVTAATFEVYQKGSTPLAPYDTWVSAFWNWDATLLNKPGTTSCCEGLQENGCLMADVGPAVILLDTAIGGTTNQNCTIKSDQGVFVSLWSGECDTSDPPLTRASYENILKCARELDLGTVKGKFSVDGTLVAELDAKDLVSNKLSNVVELNTTMFSLTYPPNTHLFTSKPGTYLAAAHGWFVFLKPLPAGDHTVSYSINVVTAGTTPGGSLTTAQYTYHFKVT
jgi:hypothetical protein